MKNIKNKISNNTMQVLKKLNENNLIFFDIETVRIEKELTPESDYYEAWKYKTRYNAESHKVGEDAITMEQLFSEKASLYAPFGKVVAVSVGKIVEEKGDKIIKLGSFYGTDEKKLLSSFNAAVEIWMKKNPNTVFVGVNSKHFDTPFLYKRMVINELEPHSSLDKSGIKPWDDRDVDLAELWKGNAFYQDSLVSITTALGLKSPKSDINGSETSNVYWDNPIDGVKRITKYCERDVVATINVFRKLCFRPIIERVESALGD